MDGGEVNRKAKRKDFSCEIKVRFPGQDTYTILAVKDISASGARVIITRLVKPKDSFEIKMCINGRDIQCKGKVAWALLLRPGFGRINSFDAGVEFLELSPEDRAFLAKLTE
ncbi:MAG: PilZ domain-containing protein [Candidatus Omnitrophica bacterium]|nr:PilZ domain-containing protein [Candidatus Omnitrophota bacterium]